MERNMDLWIKEQLAAAQKAPLPVLTFPVIQLMGISVGELIGDSHTQAAALKLLAERNHSLAAVGMMDLSVEAEAFGAEIQISEREVPSVSGKLIRTQEDADRLAVPEVGTARTGRYVDAIGEAAQLISDRPVFAGAIGPYSLAGRLMGTGEVMKASMKKGAMVHTIMEKCTRFLIDYCKAYRDAGANGVFMAEPLTGLLSPKLAETFSEPYVKAIIDEVQSETFVVIYHNCGDNAMLILPSILRTGARGYHFGNAIQMEQALAGCPHDVLCMGNVKPTSFVFGTPEALYEETWELLDRCAAQPHFVLSSGCDIPPIASWANIDSFYQAAADYAAKHSL